jgi:hypothetical protein
MGDWAFRFLHLVSSARMNECGCGTDWQGILASLAISTLSHSGH